jgi:asparagine synthase (glutamine-hydrolysing)
MDLPFETTLMDKSLWCLYFWVAKCALDAGAKILLLGQLADELFGGYAKYADALSRRGEEAARTMMEDDLREYSNRGRARDLAACRRFVQAKLPFEAEKIVSFASKLPMSHRFRNGERKALLRRAAVLLGVPTELASAPKKAAQYSSGIQKLVVRSHF